MAEILALCGFFMIYFVEEVTHAAVSFFHKDDDVSFLRLFAVAQKLHFMLTKLHIGHSHGAPHEEKPLYHHKTSGKMVKESILT